MLNLARFATAIAVPAFRAVILIVVISATHSLFAQQACVAPPSGILAWWPYDETAGPIAAELIAGRVGTYFGSSTPAPGKVGNALRLNGSTAFVGVADNDVWAFGINDFSIELWANFSTPGGGSVAHPSHIFIGNDEGPGNRNKWFFALGGGYLNFHINSPALGPQFFPLAPFSPALNTWYHLGVTRSGFLYRLYINGVLAASATNSASIPNAAAFLTMGQAENLGFINGLLDEVSMYNRALTNAEMSALWAVGTAGKCKASSGPTLQIQSVSPAVGGNAGQTTVSISGSGFQPGAIVNLISGAQTLVRGSNTGLLSPGTLQTTLDLISVSAQQSLQVQVVNPDGVSTTSPFTVVNGGSPVLQLEIVGPATARVGRAAEFVALLRNVGSIDARYATITATVQFPPSAPIALSSLFGPLFPSPPTAPQSPVWVPLNTNSPFTVVSPIPTGMDIPIRFRVTPPVGSTGCGTMQAMASAPEPPANPNPNDCDSLRNALAKVVAEIQRVEKLIQGTREEYEDRGCNSPTPITDPEQEAFCVALLRALQNLRDELADLQREQNRLNALIEEHCSNRSGSHLLQIAPSLTVTRSQSVCPINSWDPNEKVGPAGIGPALFISGNFLQYTVFFENLAAASAAAQEISIIDPLDQAIDVNTVSLQTVSLSGITLDLGGRNHLSKIVDLRPRVNALLQVQADVDTSRRQIRWMLNALDPTTLQLPADPLVGILPPNKKPPEGEGHVTFTASLKQGTPGNTTVSNQASITFDVNPPIVTPEWLNTVDRTAPASRVLALSPTQSTTSFVVRWSGNDQGAGVGTYDVFVSDNNGAFTAWQTQTTATQATFTGVNGHTYRFYSIARDLVDNVEGAKTVAEATTRVEAGSTVPGDVNGDGTVNCADIAIVRAAFGKRTGQPGWDARADVVADGVIDIRDLAFVSQKLPASMRCQ